MAHTPDPWHRRGNLIIGADGTQVVDLTGAMGGEDTEADTRLITAAPALLAALEDAHSVLKDSHSEDCPAIRPRHPERPAKRCACGIGSTLEAIEAAIAKARGACPVCNQVSAGHTCCPPPRGA